MTSKIVFGLVGASGFGREVMPYARNIVQAKFAAQGSVETVFVETNPKEKQVNSVPVMAEDDFFRLNCEQKYFNVAVADSKIRETLAARCLKNGAVPLALQGPETLILDNNEIGEGMIFCPFSMITSNVKVGKFFHSNIYSYIGHDCVIGDYVTFAPRVNCNGNIHIKDYAYIGTGAVIKQGIPSQPIVIGEGAVIGMGAVVTKSVPPGVTVVGNPAKPLEKN
jgi:sugar O-acyltransferase (sialic acid O-acetyltransferase NeuD family)